MRRAVERSFRISRPRGNTPRRQDRALSPQPSVRRRVTRGPYGDAYAQTCICIYSVRTGVRVEQDIDKHVSDPAGQLSGRRLPERRPR